MLISTTKISTTQEKYKCNINRHNNNTLEINNRSSKRGKCKKSKN